MVRTFSFLMVLLIQVSLSVHASDGNSCTKVNKAVIATTHVPPLVEVTGEFIGGQATKTLQRRMTSDFLFEVKSFPWARALRNTQIGAVDGLFPVLKSQSRMKDLLFVEPALGQVFISLFNKEGNNKRDIEDGAVVATLRSFEYDQDMLPGAVFTEVNSFDQALEMLQLGRVDYLLGVKEIIHNYIKYNDVKDIVLYQDVGQRPIYLTLSKKSDNYQNIKQCLSISDAI